MTVSVGSCPAERDAHLRVGFVGAGKIGFALGTHLFEHGSKVSGYASRTQKAALWASQRTHSVSFSSLQALLDSTDLIFITVPDGAIAETAGQLADAAASTPAGVYRRGFVMGVYDFNKTVDIQNDGDVTTFPRVVIRSDGTVENPRISIGDKFVRFVDTLKQGDELVIDFEQRPPRVTLNGRNAINKVDRASSFTSFQIEAGDTTFEYDSDSGENVMSVSLYYWKRYLGI